MLQHKGGKCRGERLTQAGKLQILMLNLNLNQQQETGSLKIQTNNQIGMKERKEDQDMKEDLLEEKMNPGRTMIEDRENLESILTVEDQISEEMNILDKKENPQDPEPGLMNTVREGTGTDQYMKMKYPGDKSLDTETP